MHEMIIYNMSKQITNYKFVESGWPIDITNDPHPNPKLGPLKMMSLMTHHDITNPVVEGEISLY